MSEYIKSPRKRIENLKNISKELVEKIIKEYPEFAENDVDFLTQLLGMELKYHFRIISKIY